MRRKIIIIITVFSIVAAAGGALLLFSINHLTSNLNELILLHRVEIQRVQLLLNIQKIQVDLYSQTTTHPESTEVMMELVNRMGVAIANCFHCHHEERVNDALLDVQEQIGHFDDQFSRALAVRLDAQRFEWERQQANIIGDSLISKLSTMIKLTEERLAERSLRSQRDMWLSELIVLGLVILGPLMVAAFGFKTLSGFRQAVVEADIICTATTSASPVFSDTDLKPGVHINAVGAYTPDMQEVPAETVRCARVIVDSRPAALSEAGDLIQPLRQGLIGEDHLITPS